MKAPTIVASLLAALALVACGGDETTTAGDGAGASGAGSPAASAAKPPAAQHQQQGPSQGQDGTTGRGSQGGGGKGGGKGAAKGVPGDTSASFTAPTHSDSGGGATQFEVKGGDNSIQQFGSEAGGSDFASAAASLHGYLDARAAGAWSDACSYMAPGLVASLAQLGSGGGVSCPELLASLTAGISPASLQETAEADVAALRVEGDRAFLLFHGAHDSDYFMPMARQGGEWKVGAIAPSALL